MLEPMRQPVTWRDLVALSALLLLVFWGIPEAQHQVVAAHCGPEHTGLSDYCYAYYNENPLRAWLPAGAPRKFGPSDRDPMLGLAGVPLETPTPSNR